MRHAGSAWGLLRLAAQGVLFGGMLLGRWTRRGMEPPQDSFAAVSLMHAKEQAAGPHARLALLARVLLWVGAAGFFVSALFDPFQ